MGSVGWLEGRRSLWSELDSSSEMAKSIGRMLVRGRVIEVLSRRVFPEYWFIFFFYGINFGALWWSHASWRSSSTSKSPRRVVQCVKSIASLWVDGLRSIQWRRAVVWTWISSCEVILKDMSFTVIPNRVLGTWVRGIPLVVSPGFTPLLSSHSIVVK